GGDLQSPISAAATAASPAGLLTEVKLTLTASAESSAGSSSVELRDYALSIRPGAAGVAKISDGRATFLLALLGLVGGVLLVVGVLGWWATRARTSFGWPHSGINPRLVVGAAGFLVGVLVVNVLLFGLGKAPFDMADQETWSYLAVHYGPAQVFLLAPFVTVAKAWNGIPYSEAVFPYQPVMVNLFE